MKKEYMKPNTRITELEISEHLLAESNEPEPYKVQYTEDEAGDDYEIL